jgi:hypothetical protein
VEEGRHKYFRYEKELTREPRKATKQSPRNKSYLSKYQNKKLSDSLSFGL